MRKCLDICINFQYLSSVSKRNVSKHQTCKLLARSLHGAVPDVNTKWDVMNVFDDDIRMFEDFRTIELVRIVDGGQLLIDVVNVVVDHRCRPDEVVLEDSHAAQRIDELTRR